MGLWLNLRRSLSKSSILKNRKIKVISEPVENYCENKTEIFKFPYGTKECVVYKSTGKLKCQEGGGIKREVLKSPLS